MTQTASRERRSEPLRRRHHYLPECYLRAWADHGGQVAVRRRDRPVPFCTKPLNVAVEVDLYSLPSDTGRPDDTIEKALSMAEAFWASHLTDLRSGRLPRKRSAARAEISYLLALQMVRTPEHMDGLTFPGDAARSTGERPISREGMRWFLIDEYLLDPPSESELQGALDFANGSLAQGEPSRQEVFPILFEIAEAELAPRLAAMAWSLERSNGPAWVTSDRPVAVWRRRARRDVRMGAGLLSADEIWFPLGPWHLLVLRPQLPRILTFVEPARVADVNRHLSRGCYTMVIGRPEELADLAVLPLRARRPAMRFNSGPLVETGSDGRAVPTGWEVVHAYVPFGDDGVE